MHPIILVFLSVALLQTVIQKCEGKIYSSFFSQVILAILTILYEIVLSNCCSSRKMLKVY